jgi:adenylate kinase
LTLVDISSLARKHRLVSKTHEVDVRKLARKMLYLGMETDFVAEGHLACEIRLPADFIIVLRCKPEVLRRRLKKRRYSKSKIEDNLLTEALDYCTQRAQKIYKRRPLELETSGRSVAGCVKILAAAIRDKKKTLDTVDHSGYLSRGLSK